jgi:hypothetical protein
MSKIVAAGSVLSQLTGWILTGLAFAAFSLRVPGKVGLVRALAISAAWFGAASVVQLINGWTRPSGGWAWTFPWLELLLFLAAFSIVWDAYTLKERTWKKTLGPLREGYRIQQYRTVVLYAIPLLVAIVAVGQQLASGSGIDFVKSLLSLPLALFPGS